MVTNPFDENQLDKPILYFKEGEKVPEICKTCKHSEVTPNPNVMKCNRVIYSSRELEDFHSPMDKEDTCSHWKADSWNLRYDRKYNKTRNIGYILRNYILYDKECPLCNEDMKAIRNHAIRKNECIVLIPDFSGNGFHIDIIKRTQIKYKESD